MKFHLVLAVAFSAMQAVAPSCDTNLLKQCTTIETIIAYKQWPHNISDVQNICQEFINAMFCISEFERNCVLNPIAMRISQWIHMGLLMNVRDSCDHDQAILERMQCYWNPNSAKDIIENHQKYVGLVETAATYDKNKRFPLYCCAIIYLQEMNWSANIKVCNRAVAYYFDSALNVLFDQPFHEMCLGFYSLNDCTFKLDSTQLADFKRITGAEPPLPTRNELALPTLYKILLDI